MIGKQLEYSESLPPSWSVKTVGDIGSYLNGFAFKPMQWGSTGLPIIRIQNLNDMNKPFNYYDGEVPEKYRIRDGDILISWSASLGTYRWNRGDAWLNQHIFKATPNLEELSDEFFYWVMVHGIERIAGNARGSTMKHVTGKEFANSQVALPPLPEQKKIAHILSTVQRAIKAQERIIQTTTELFKSMLHQLMTAQIRVSSGDCIAGSYEEYRGMSEWQTKCLGDVLQLNYGKSLSVKNRVEGSIPVYGSNGVVGSHNEAIVDAPGLIVGRKGSAGQVHRSLGPFCPIDTTFYVTAADAPDVDLEFLFYLLRHIDLTRITGDVGVPGLNREMAYMEPVHFPAALPEQKKIAHILSIIQQKVDNAQSKKSKLEDLFRTLLHELMTAKKRVHGIKFGKEAVA